MHGHTRALRKALEAVGDHLAAQLAEPLPLEAKINDAVGSIRDIDDCAGKGLVERRVGVAEACKTSGCSEGGGESVTEGNADIFSSMVVVNYTSQCSVYSCSKRARLTVEITLTVDCQRPASMLRQGMQHVVQEAYACVDGDSLRLGGLRCVRFILGGG